MKRQWWFKLVDSNTTKSRTTRKGIRCNFCHYRRQKEDINPEWECPKCQRAYHKVPLGHEKMPKNKYVGSLDTEPSFFSRIPLEQFTSLCIVLLDLAYGWSTDWQTLTPKLTPTDHVVIVLLCLVIIWFGEQLTTLSYKYLPIRTGIMEHLARKNEHEDKFIIKHMPRLTVLSAWAFLIWFILKVSWL